MVTSTQVVEVVDDTVDDVVTDTVGQTHCMHSHPSLGAKTKASLDCVVEVVVEEVYVVEVVCVEEVVSGRSCESEVTSSTGGMAAVDDVEGKVEGL